MKNGWLTERELRDRTYGYSFDEEGPYKCGFYGVDDALEAAFKEAVTNGSFWNKEGWSLVYIGMRTESTAEIDSDDADFIVAREQDKMNDVTLGVSCDIYHFLDDVTKESLDRLAEKLNTALREWAAEEKISLTVSYMDNVKRYDLRTGDVWK